VFKFNHRPALGFVGTWFFVTVAPTSSVVPIVGSPTAKLRMYLPLAAIIILTVIGAGALGNRSLKKHWRIVLGCVAGASVVALLTSLTIHRNRDHLSELGIWQDSAGKCPNNPRAHTSLGLRLVGHDRLPEAIAHFELALRIRPGDIEALNNLGLAQAQLDRRPEAIEQWQQALQIKPDYADPYFNLGVALEQAGRVQEATAHYEWALRINRDYVQAQDALARLRTVR
jgi:tetratricopeptide (TPR) repeat protein